MLKSNDTLHASQVIALNSAKSMRDFDLRFGICFLPTMPSGSCIATDLTEIFLLIFIEMIIN